MIKKCLLDMDGVLVDFVKSAIKHHNLPEDIYDKPENLGNFDLTALSGLSAKEFWTPMDYDFWINLDWMPEGQMIVYKVIEKFGKENVCLLSTPCATAGCSDAKIEWIKRHLPDFRNRYLLGASKHFCANKDNYLIDDRDANIADFNNHGGNGILLPRAWNSEYKDRNNTIEVLSKKLENI